MQRISACEAVSKTFREILGVNPHKELPQAAKFLGRVSTFVYPKIYAATTIPRSEGESHLIQRTMQKRVQKRTERYLGYYGAKALAYGVKYAGEAAYQIGHASKAGVKYFRAF